MKLARIALALVAAAAFGCGEEAPTTVAPTSAPPPAMAPAPAPGGKTVTVTVGPNNSLTFSPQTVNIKVGDMVTWNWVSSIAHTVTSGVPGAPDGKFCSLPAGMTVNGTNCNSIAYARTAPFTYSFTFNSAGTFPYFCEVHQGLMTGSVVVTAAASTGGTTGGGTTGGGGGTTGGGGGTTGGGGRY